MYQSGASLVGHVFLWVCGSCFWRKWNGRIKGRLSEAFPIRVPFKLMRGTDVDTTLGLLSRIVRKEMVIMHWLDLWSYTAPTAVIYYVYAWPLVPVSISCPYLLPYLMSLVTSSHCPLILLCFCDSCIKLTSYLSLPCKVLFFLVFYLSVRLNWHDALCYQNISSLLKSSVSRIIFQPCFCRPFIISLYLSFFSETSPSLPSTSISVL